LFISVQWSDIFKEIEILHGFSYFSVRMETNIHILLIEKNSIDHAKFESDLQKSGIEYLLRTVGSIKDIDKVLLQFLPDLVVCDFTSLSLRPTEAIHRIHGKLPDIPVIMYSGVQDEATVVDSMKSGAADYIFKDHPARLFYSIYRAIYQKRIQDELLLSRERFNTLAKVSTVGIFLASADGAYLYVNECWCAICGITSEQALGDGFLQAVHSHDKKRIKTEWQRCVKEKRPFHSEYRIFRESDKTELWVLGHALPEFMADGTFAGFVGTITDITYRMNTEMEIDASRKQLRALTVRLQSIREEERTEISREIHDDLGQALTGLRMDIAWLNSRLSRNDEKVASRLKTMLELTDTTIHKVRKISTDLRPGILDDIGLAAAIEWHGSDVGERAGIQFTFDLVEDLQLDEQRSTAFFRIFQESLTNVLRHARAKHVHVSLRRERTMLLLSIEDDGRGIQPHEISNPRSVGILGMRERAAVFGGEVNIIGAAGKGTTVRVRVPLAMA